MLSGTAKNKSVHVDFKNKTDKHTMLKAHFPLFLHDWIEIGSQIQLQVVVPLYPYL